MLSCKRSFLFLIGVQIITGFLVPQWPVLKEDKGIKFYQKLLNEIKLQQTYDGLLIVDYHQTPNSRLEMLYALAEPKIILNQRPEFYYRAKYNREIMAVIIMEQGFHWQAWQLLARTINFMRQIRILMIFVNANDELKLRQDTLKACEADKITHALIHFLNTSSLMEPATDFLQLHLYPAYHFHELRNFNPVKEKYFLCYWQDMKGKTLLTMLDQIVPRSLMFKDANNEIKLTGYVVKLVTLFTELFNATLKLAFLPKVKQNIHFTIIADMAKHGKLDLPMSITPLREHSNNSLWSSDPIEVADWMLMIPCARRMKISEVFEIVFTPQIGFLIFAFAIMFSLLHTLIEKLFFNQMLWLNLLMSDKIIPGILGQSFKLKNSYLISLRLTYVLLFVMGLYISTLFSAHLQTLITSPPCQSEITTFEQLQQSGQKILMDQLDIKYFGSDDYVLSVKMKDTVEVTNSTTGFNKHRQSLNLTYGYSVTTSLWDIFEKIQQHHAQPTFCVNRALNIRNLILYTIPLEPNSVLLEPLNSFINRMHTIGLLEAWQRQIFGDLLKLKEITLRDSSRFKTYEDLKEGDLIIVWIILIFGLCSSLLVFFIELLINYYRIENLKRN